MGDFVMNDYFETALSFVESAEMREYFRQTLLAGKIPTRLRFNPVRDCREFIVGSRASIDSKLAALKTIPPSKDTLDYIRVAESALVEKKSVKDNVFLVTLNYPYNKDNEPDVWENRKPFLSYESALKWIHNETSRQVDLSGENPEKLMDLIWFEVEKFISGEDGDLVHSITWTLNAEGDIMFFELGDDFKKYKIRSCEAEDNDDLVWLGWEGSGNWEYPPIPFDFGDIISIDMRPFYHDFRGVIVRIHDNCICCAVACVHCDEDGYLYCNTLKHDMNCLHTKVSPLFRAERFVGDLPDNERSLEVISDAIRKTIPEDVINEGGYCIRNHNLANQFDDFLYSREYERKDGYSGCSWDEFKERFGL